jgi:vacuolar-type H+-ATPase subunit E/Vma4
MTPRDGTEGSLPGPVGIAAALRPVSDTLLRSAQQRADEHRAAAREQVVLEVQNARSEAGQLLADARAEGAAAAEWIASRHLAAARREAREIVLGAQRSIYETLRREAIAALARHAGTPEGRMLAGRLSALVDERLGDGAPVHREHPEDLSVEAESGNRRAGIGPSALIDHLLVSTVEEIEGLWA